MKTTIAILAFVATLLIWSQTKEKPVVAEVANEQKSTERHIFSPLPQEEINQQAVLLVARTHTAEITDEFREAFPYPDDVLEVFAENIVLHDVTFPGLYGYTEEEASYLPKEMVEQGKKDVATAQEALRASLLAEGKLPAELISKLAP